MANVCEIHASKFASTKYRRANTGTHNIHTFIIFIHWDWRRSLSFAKESKFLFDYSQRYFHHPPPPSPWAIGSEYASYMQASRRSSTHNEHRFTHRPHPLPPSTISVDHVRTNTLTSAHTVNLIPRNNDHRLTTVAVDALCNIHSQCNVAQQHSVEPFPYSGLKWKTYATM